MSVVIPVYNCAPYLRECVGSAAAAAEQVEKVGGEWSVEIIFVDDGSTDGSSEILEEFTHHRSPSPSSFTSLVLRQKNAGVSAARNAAIEAASGDWVTFVDADDFIAADWLANMIELIDANPDADFIHIRDFTVVREGPPMSAFLARPTRKGKVSVARGDDARRTARRRLARDGWSVLNCVRRDLIGDVRFREGLRIKEDVIFFLELARKCSGFVEADRSGYFYRVHADSALRSFRRVEDCLRFGETLLKMERDEDTDDFSRALGYDVIQWMEERDWSGGYDGTSCPLRRLWREGMSDGRIRIDANLGWWRPGLRRWVRSGDLSLLRRTRRVRVKLGEWILFTGRVLWGRRWTRQSI